MFNEHVKRTDKILVGGDCLLTKQDMDLFIELIEIEEENLRKVFLDSWEFQIGPRVVFMNFNAVKDQPEFNRTRVYLAEKAMLNSKYEIRKGKLDNYEFEIEKQWHVVTKTRIQKYLSRFKSIIIDAKKSNKLILSSYY